MPLAILLVMSGWYDLTNPDPCNPRDWRYLFAAALITFVLAGFGGLLRKVPRAAGGPG